MKTRTAAIVSIFLGLLAVFLTAVYFQGKEKALFKGATLTKVLVAATDIPERAMVKEDMLTAKMVPSTFLQPTAISSIQDATGKITIAPVKTGGQILGSFLVFPSARTGLAVKIPRGKRAYILPLEHVDITELVKPGDYIDVLSTFTVGGEDVTVTILQNVLVLAIGKSMGEIVAEEKKPRRGGFIAGPTTSVLNVSLALTPMEAEFLALMEPKGKLKLIVRPLGDDTILQLEPLTFKSLLTTREK